MNPKSSEIYIKDIIHLTTSKWGDYVKQGKDIYVPNGTQFYHVHISGNNYFGVDSKHYEDHKNNLLIQRQKLD